MEIGFIAKYPSQRGGDADEVASVIEFLTSASGVLNQRWLPAEFRWRLVCDSEHWPNSVPATRK